MRRIITKSTAFVLALAVLFGMAAFAPSAAQITTAGEWNGYWADNAASINAAVIVAPGQYESERNISWYSAEHEGSCFALVSLNADMSDAVTFNGECETTPQGDCVNKVTVTDLLPGKTYYYTCHSGSFVSPVGKITTLDGNDFSAIYVTDVHISCGEDKNAVRDGAFIFNSVLTQASGANGISLLLSSGDQASAGAREEYAGFVSSPAVKDITAAITVGNHDRKNIDYRYFNANPETDDRGIKSYVGSDYWFVKGDALFLVMDSNNSDMVYHRAFIKNAVKANPDVKWRVAMLHHDLFGGRIPHRESENGLLRTIWCPVIDEFAIDLVLTGHSHYYTISNVIYNKKTVASTADISAVTDAGGTIYMVSGSVTRPRELDEGEIPPLGENIGQSLLSDKAIYNVLDFSENSIVIKSYTLGNQEAFNTFTINKTTQQGGHPDKISPFYSVILRYIGKIVAIFNNIGVIADIKEDLGIQIPILKGIFG